MISPLIADRAENVRPRQTLVSVQRPEAAVEDMNE